MGKTSRINSKKLITENDIKKQVKDYLFYTSWFNFPILQGLGAYKGIPDIIAVKEGRVLFIEVKKLGGQQSEHQREFQKQIESHGGKYLIIRGIDELINYLKEKKNE